MGERKPIGSYLHFRVIIFISSCTPLLQRVSYIRKEIHFHNSLYQSIKFRNSRLFKSLLTYFDVNLLTFHSFLHSLEKRETFYIKPFILKTKENIILKIWLKFFSYSLITFSFFILRIFVLKKMMKVMIITTINLIESIK